MARIEKMTRIVKMAMMAMPMRAIRMGFIEEIVENDGVRGACKLRSRGCIYQQLGVSCRKI